jgi:nucleoside-diphosphate-sugar epimerase
VGAWEEVSGRRIDAFEGDLTDRTVTANMVREVASHAIVHFAEQGSTPSSMIERAHAVDTQTDNLVGTPQRPLCHRRDRPGDPLGEAGKYGTVECIRSAVEHPSQPGELRVFKQVTEEFSARGLAQMIMAAFQRPVELTAIEDPRVEAPEHCNHATHSRLLDLGLKPHLLSNTVMESPSALAESYRANVDPSLLGPTVRWTLEADRVAPRVAAGVG